MPKDNDFVKKAVIYGGLVLAAAGAGYALSTMTGEEERPPIIIQNGTLDFRAEYADSQYNSKGEWEQIGSSGKYRIKHDYLSGPNYNSNGAYNFLACSGTLWRKDAITISFTDGATTWKVDVHVTGKYLQIDPQPGLPVTIDAADPSHLIAGTAGVATWITRLEPRGGSVTDYCMFGPAKSGVIRVEQKR